MIEGKDNQGGAQGVPLAKTLGGAPRLNPIEGLRVYGWDLDPEKTWDGQKIPPRWLAYIPMTPDEMTGEAGLGPREKEAQIRAAAGLPAPEARPGPEGSNPQESEGSLIQELVGALEAVKEWRGVGLGNLEHFEHIGDLFYSDTGYLRPGKSEPVETYTEDREERKRVAWQEWCQKKNAALDVKIDAALSKARKGADPTSQVEG